MAGYDRDPLDVLVLCSEPLEPLTLVRCYPIGMISMIDSGRNDEKIIAIPVKKTPTTPHPEPVLCKIYKSIKQHPLA